MDYVYVASLWNIVISTVVFVIAAWAIRRYLELWGLPKSILRGLLVLILAYMLSWLSGMLVDYAQEKIEGKPPGLTIDLGLASDPDLSDLNQPLPAQ